MMRSVKLIGGTNDKRVVKVPEGRAILQLRIQDGETRCYATPVTGGSIELHELRAEVYRMETIVAGRHSLHIGVHESMDIGEAMLVILSQY